MPDDDDFTDLMARAKAGDQAAIREFLSRFDREVQMMVRAPLAQETTESVRLRRFYPSGMAEFFFGPTAGCARF